MHFDRVISFFRAVGPRRSVTCVNCALSPIHTADAYATPTQLNSTVRRRRCVLGFKNALTYLLTY